MELIKETKTRAEIIAYLTRTATADSETDVEAFMKVFNPVDDRKEMGKVYQEALGYNPITHYDIKDIIWYIEGAIGRMSKAAAEKVAKSKDSIAKKAAKLYEDRREENLKTAVADVLVNYLTDEDDLTKVGEYLIGTSMAYPNSEESEDFEDDEDEDDGGLRVIDDDTDMDDLDSSIPSLDDTDDDDLHMDGESDEDYEEGDNYASED